MSWKADCRMLVLILGLEIKIRKWYIQKKRKTFKPMLTIFPISNIK